jgi:hypothetical protein
VVENLAFIKKLYMILDMFNFWHTMLKSDN